MSRKRDAYTALGQLARADAPEAKASLGRLVALGRSGVVAVDAGDHDRAAAMIADYEAKLLLSAALPCWQWGEV